MDLEQAQRFLAAAQADYADRVREWAGKEAIGWQPKGFGLPQPLARARVVVTFTHRSRRYMGDVDNLYRRAKPLVDALKGILIVDDSPALHLCSRLGTA